MNPGEQRRTVVKALNLKNDLNADDFDHGIKGHKYKVNLNFNVLWSREHGFTVTQEKLPSNPSKVLHDRITRVTWRVFCDDWLKAETFNVEISINVSAMLKMCLEPFLVINIFTRRDAYKYDRAGNLKKDFTMPDNLLISPATEDGKDRITQLTLENSDIRGVLNEVNLHRLGEETLACEVNGIIECYEHTTIETTGTGREYIAFNRIGGIGVGGDSAKAIGRAVNVVTGKGLHSVDNGEALSSLYRGRCSSEGYMVTIISCRTPIPPGPQGHKLFRKNHLISEGIALLKILQDYEFHSLALQTPDPDIPKELDLGKKLKLFIVRGQ